MSKVFKSFYENEMTITAHNDHDRFLVCLEVLDNRNARPVNLMFENAKAPAVALAIIEASGITPKRSDSWTVGEPDNLARIAADLQHHIEVRDKHAKEAAEREVLEGEAWELYKARTSGSSFPAFHYLERSTQAEWVAVAITARTMYGGTK